MGQSGFTDLTSFTLTDSFSLSPIDLPNGAALTSLILDLTPTITNTLSVQQPTGAPGNSFATSRQLTNITITAGGFSHSFANAGALDLFAAGLTTADLDNNPLVVGWTTTVNFSGSSNQPGPKNTSFNYTLQNTGSSQLSASLSGAYSVADISPVPAAVPEPSTSALFAIGAGLVGFARKKLKNSR